MDGESKGESRAATEGGKTFPRPLSVKGGWGDLQANFCVILIFDFIYSLRSPRALR